jgi:nudix-type nucleoside diphosphatase (YffH/AdpP family)
LSSPFLIRGRRRLLDDFFKVDELTIAHQQTDGTMSVDHRRLVFERGDSAAVLLMNLDTKCLVLIDQFRAPTVGKGQRNGWVVEAIAGMIGESETPIAAAIRETMEETGYELLPNDLRHITTFFSSPGGSSERIFLYYAQVREGHRRGKGGGVDGEDLKVLHISTSELLAQFRSGSIEDPKLVIGLTWLEEELRAHARQPLEPGTVRYCLKENRDFLIGYKTGPISSVKEVDIWVNSENEDMIMDRFVGNTISANIRYLGSVKDANGNVIEDTINDELLRAVGNDGSMHGQAGRVRVGTVFATSAGDLKNPPHRVRRVLHIATVTGVAAGRGFRAHTEDLARCTKNVLTKAHELNTRFSIARLFRRSDCKSILFPMFGAGDGNLGLEEVTPEIIGASVSFFKEVPESSVKEIYLLAFTSEHKAACDRVLEHHEDLERLP